MLQKLFTVLIVLSLLPVFLYAQERTILKPKGMTYLPNGNRQNPEVIPLNKWEKSRMQRMHQNKNIIRNSSNSDNPLNLLDTLFIVPDGALFATRFGMYGQDRLVQWFVAPADLYLKEVGFAFRNADTPFPQVEVKIVGFQPNITTEDLEYLTSSWVGSYEATGNGYNDVTAFLDDPDRTGPWTGINGHPEVFGNDIWSDLGVGLAFTPFVDSVNLPPVYQFIDLNALGYPDIKAGTIFGVVVKNLHPVANTQVVRLACTTVDAGNNQFSLWKFYQAFRLTTDDRGWWSRDAQTFMAAVIEIYGNTAPDINSFTIIPSDVNLGPFTVDANITDENPGNPDSAGVASAKIQWSTDGGTNWNDVAMTGSEPNFTGQIPAQSSNTTVTYRISSTDITNKTSTSNEVEFYIFQPSGASTLVIFNGFNELTGFPQDAYWGPGVDFEYDSWNYGTATTALLNNYDNVIEIWDENFGVYNDDIIRTWIEGEGNRNYFLAGQEYLGAKNGYIDSPYVAGDFEYDILGLTHSYNDITYYGPSNNSIGDSLPTLLLPQSGTLFGTPLLDLFNSLVPPADSLMFNPLFVLNPPGLSENLNWQDGFDVSTDVIVDMKVETRGIGSQGVPRPNPTVQELPTLAHRTLPAGNKIIFHAYDPIALTTAVNDTYPYFYWVGVDSLNSVFQALRWFDIVLSANETGGNLPSDFSIAQNYPNPFNPVTTIKFSIPQSSKVTLKVYDILGREVSTLINDTRNAGNYEVNFEASGLASGMYIYTITAGDYTASKKMMLLK
jgi:Secretion system C-terminal sorting domain